MSRKKSETAIRKELAEAASALHRLGLGVGSAGNLSERTSDGMLITPSALSYAEMTAQSIVAIDCSGRLLEEHRLGLRPSSEWLLHAAIFSNCNEACAVVHCHSPYATALSCLRLGIPAFHYMVAVAGGDTIPCALYATFGTRALADQVVATLLDEGGRSACLMANHGQIVYASNLADAVSLAEEVEMLARQYILCRQAGSPVLLERSAMNEVLKAFQHYRSK